MLVSGGQGIMCLKVTWVGLLGLHVVHSSRVRLCSLLHAPNCTFVLFFSTSPSLPHWWNW